MRGPAKLARGVMAQPSGRGFMTQGKPPQFMVVAGAGLMVLNEEGRIVAVTDVGDRDLPVRTGVVTVVVGFGAMRYVIASTTLARCLVDDLS